MKANEIKVLEKYEKQVQELIDKNRQDIASLQDSLKQAQDNLGKAKDKSYSALNSADPEEYAAACESVRRCEDVVTFFETKLEEAKTGSIVSKKDADAIIEEIKRIVEKRREACQKELDEIQARGADIIIEYKDLLDRAYRICNTIELKIERTSDPKISLLTYVGDLRHPNISVCVAQRLREQELKKVIKK